MDIEIFVIFLNYSFSGFTAKVCQISVDMDGVLEMLKLSCFWVSCTLMKEVFPTLFNIFAVYGKGVDLAILNA